MMINKDDSILYFDSLQKKMLPNSIKLDENNNASKEEIIKVSTFFLQTHIRIKKKL